VRGKRARNLQLGANLLEFGLDPVGLGAQDQVTGRHGAEPTVTRGPGGRSMAYAIATAMASARAGLLLAPMHQARSTLLAAVSRIVASRDPARQGHSVVHPAAVLVREVGVLGMAAHPGVDERTGRNDAEPALAGVVQRGAGEGAADALALESIVNLGMGVDDKLRRTDVLGETSQSAVYMRLEAAALARVCDDRRGIHYPSVEPPGAHGNP